MKNILIMFVLSMILLSGCVTSGDIEDFCEEKGYYDFHFLNPNAFFSDFYCYNQRGLQIVTSNIYTLEEVEYGKKCCCVCQEDKE